MESSQLASFSTARMELQKRSMRESRYLSPLRIGTFSAAEFMKEVSST